MKGLLPVPGGRTLQGRMPKGPQAWVSGWMGLAPSHDRGHAGHDPHAPEAGASGRGAALDCENRKMRNMMIS